MVLTFLFHRSLHRFEVAISAFKDTEFCIAYARSQLIPAQVAATMQRISDGDIAQFTAAMEQLKEVLK